LSDLSDYEKTTYIKLNQTVKRVSEDIDRLQFNTAIAALMELEHDFKPDQIKNDTLNDYIILKAIQLIAPMAPHLAEEMWHLCGNELSVFRSAWPDYDPDALKFDTVTIAIQVNGKLRSEMAMPRDSAQNKVIAAALNDDKVKTYTDGREIIKGIYIPNRLVNIVIK